MTLSVAFARGSSLPVSMRSETRSISRFPIRPAGWFMAYWSWVKCFACIPINSAPSVHSTSAMLLSAGFCPSKCGLSFCPQKGQSCGLFFLTRMSLRPINTHGDPATWQIWEICMYRVLQSQCPGEDFDMTAFKASWEGTCMRAMATVSPKTIWRAVEVTGAKSKGQSSLCKGRWTDISHIFASLQSWWQATLTSVAPFACTCAHLIWSPLLERSCCSFLCLGCRAYGLPRSGPPSSVRGTKNAARFVEAW